MQAPNRHLTRVVVLASGTGSNLQAILDACANRELAAEVVAVVSDKDNAYALKRAADAGVPSVHVGRQPTRIGPTTTRDWPTSSAVSRPI
jgi:folate-dependent phosphoribosylglycinamide formyltransferase PurN